MLQLSAQRRQFGRVGVGLPRAVALLSVSWCTPLFAVVSPDGEPRFKEGTGHSQFAPNRPSQQVGERLTLFQGQLFGLVEKKRAVEPQVFSHTADLVPVTPRRRRWLERRQQAGCGGEFGNGRWIGRRQLEPLANRAMVDPELAADSPSGRNVLMQRMCLGDAHRATRQA